ncbi:MAG: DUF4431 domain-containing protein [Gemmatimonadales bacterium]
MIRRYPFSTLGFTALALAAHWACESAGSDLERDVGFAEARSAVQSSTAVPVRQEAEISSALEVSPDTLTLQGILLLGDFYGPPNYGEEPTTDRLERQYYLQLPAPILTQVPDATLPGDAEANRASAYFLQVVIEDSDRLDPRAHVGEKVQVTGPLMEWWSGHHRTPLLLVVQNLEPVDRWLW